MDTPVGTHFVDALATRLKRFEGTSVDLDLDLADDGSRLEAKLSYDRAEVRLTLDARHCGLAWDINHRGWYMHAAKLEFDAADQQRWSRARNLFQLIGTYPLVVCGATRPLPWRKPWQLICGSVVIDSGDGPIPPSQSLEAVLLPAVK